MVKYSVQFNRKSFTLVEGGIARTMFNGATLFIGLSFALYLSFLGMTILNIVERNDLESENRTLSSRVSELELSYLSETEKVNIALAYSLGFKEAKNPVFAGGDRAQALARSR